MKLISINQAAAAGIDRLRRPIWKSPFDHLKVDIINDPGSPAMKAGPWTHLFCPCNQSFNGRDPVDILFIGMDYDEEIWQPYDGALPTSTEYIQEQVRYSEL